MQSAAQQCLVKGCYDDKFIAKVEFNGIMYQSKTSASGDKSNLL
jgi:hypothetical protein